MKKIILLIACAAALASCAKNMNSNVYTEGSTPGKVLEGKVINVRAVTIKAHDKLQDNTAGGLAGGAVGGVAGSQVGRGGGSVASTVGGALVGAVAGALIQDQLGTQQGTEYLVKIDKKYLQEFHKITKKTQSKGGVESDMTSGTNVSTKTDIVSIVEATDPDLKVGSRVYVIYNDDRPRLVANNDK